MARAVALLRSVNVGGNRMTMAFLRELATAAGCREVETVLATGNVVMAEPDDLEHTRRTLAEALAEGFGPIDVVMRTHAELADAVARNPWAADVGTGTREGRFVHTMFLQSQPVAEAIASLARDDSDDLFAVSGREVFVAFADGSQGSRYQGSWFERHLQVVGTMRNHNTVEKLVAAST
ncbi:DUF1697 domain-containing protein [Salsipaludibacter albus]|uniref:DUF1697 domain-containing protein n=1 Tax=Salsipaludibacter albus TaxID=2849650 RepID=UPI001EE49661|nr:DUF1697 domain-containing protein [Salsipaludibacter albus]